MKYIALLRGINVGGHKKMEMKELKTLFEKLGFKNVATYINSGNVIFEASGKTEALESKIKKEIIKLFGFEVEVMVRTDEEMKAVVDDNPFKSIPINDKNILYVSFLLTEPESEKVKALEALSNKGEMFKVIEKQVYILTKLNIARESLLGKGIIDKQLKIPSTNRNWNTVNKLVSLSA